MKIDLLKSLINQLTEIQEDILNFVTILFFIAFLQLIWSMQSFFKRRQVTNKQFIDCC